MSPLYFAFFFVAVIVAFAGYFIIKQFSGGIKAMQAESETRWDQQDAAEAARITEVKNKAAGMV